MAENDEKHHWALEHLGLLLLGVPWLGAVLHFIANPRLWIMNVEVLTAVLMAGLFVAVLRRFGLPVRVRKAIVAIIFLSLARASLDRDVIYVPYFGVPALLVAAWFGFGAMKEDAPVAAEEPAAAEEEEEEEAPGDDAAE